MNNIDMRFGATIGMGNIGVENVEIERRYEERTAGIRVENFRVSTAVGILPEISHPDVDLLGGLHRYREKRSSAPPPK